MSEDDASGAASADTPTIYSTTAYSDDLKEFQCELAKIFGDWGLTSQETRDIFEMAGKPVPRSTMQGWVRNRKAQGQIRTPNKNSGRPRKLEPDDERIFFCFVLAQLAEKEIV